MSRSEQTVTGCPPAKKKEESSAFNTAMLQVVGLRHLGIINLASLIACNARQFQNIREIRSTDTGGHAIDM